MSSEYSVSPPPPPPHSQKICIDLSVRLRMFARDVLRPINGIVEDEIRESWRRKLRNTIDGYISLFPDFMSQFSISAQRIKSST
jgi:hypothetical protein